MTSERQFGLLPECGDEVRFPLHGFEAIASELANLADRIQAEVGDLVCLQVAPNGLDRIEFGSVGRQTGDGKMTALFLKPGAYLATAVDGCAIPDDQERALDLALEGAEEFDDLLRANGAGKEAEVELPERQSGDRRQLLPGEAVLQHRRVTAQTPSTRHARAFAQSGFVDEDDGSAFALGFF